MKEKSIFISRIISNYFYKIDPITQKQGVRLPLVNRIRMSLRDLLELVVQKIKHVLDAHWHLVLPVHHRNNRFY